MTKITFTIDGHLPSRANVRGHWRKRNALTRKQRNMGRIATLAAIGQRRIVFPVHVTMTRVSARRLDSDNIAGACKNLRDGIADALGYDDSHRSPITWEPKQEKGNPPRVRVEIETRKETG